MYKQVVLLMLGAMSLLSVSAQNSVEKFFMSMPEDLLWLDQSQRKELFAYFKDKKVDSIQNNLNGYCKLIDYNENTKHLFLNSSQKGSMEMQILGTESAPLIATIYTVCAPACHSNICFYTPEWKVAEVILPMISNSDFLKNGLSEYDLAIAHHLMTPLFVSYTFQGGTNQIVATCNARQFLSESDWQQLKPMLKSEHLTIALQDGTWKIML